MHIIHPDCGFLDCAKVTVSQCVLPPFVIGREGAKKGPAKNAGPNLFAKKDKVGDV